ncbi:MAG TPA: DNA polymerase III subunit gamma/tau [Solirubrobacteraceae bacterium]|nr:DNA polymerase III subunit gamma/tau [Solirubrobacteraceae bacterium]
MPNQPQVDQQTSSLYRRHRPRTFEEVVGQEPVVRTLSNAVERDQVHHAYLFVGSRGTGKTSMAKILAACLNCEHGPTVQPCGACDSCIAIARASSLDVIEMDAASNNSVDDIRDLRDSVAFAPVSGRRKVYILDEAHMLSTAAWNAFLKTLEEPPPDTVFVLATTEAQKVPATVIDRCQRFDFQRPTVEQIAQVLRRTAQSEDIEIPAEAVAALARSATGSFRDALGTLEQLLAYSGPTIALEDVLAVLGVPDAQLLEQTLDAVATGDARAALLALAECTEAGRDAASFAAALQARARELLIVQTLGEMPAELALTPESDAHLLEQAARVPHGAVVRLLELLAEALEGVRAGTDQRTSLELALVKAARPEVDSSTKALLARIERLETGVGDSRQDARNAAPPMPERLARSVSATGPTARSTSLETTADSKPARKPESAATPATGQAVHVSENPPEAQPAPAGQPAPEGPLRDLQSLADLWPAVVKLVETDNRMVGAVIADAVPVAAEGAELVVGFPASASFLKRKAEDPANRTLVGEALRELTGARWRVSYELRDELEAGDGGEPRSYSEEEWIERFKTELDAEEVPLDPSQPADGSREAALDGQRKEA